MSDEAKTPSDDVTRSTVNSPCHWLPFFFKFLLPGQRHFGQWRGQGAQTQGQSGEEPLEKVVGPGEKFA